MDANAQVSTATKQISGMVAEQSKANARLGTDAAASSIDIYETGNEAVGLSNDQTEAAARAAKQSLRTSEQLSVQATDAAVQGGNAAVDAVNEATRLSTQVATDNFCCQSEISTCVAGQGEMEPCYSVASKKCKATCEALRGALR